MKKEIKLTQKQEQVLNSLNKMLEKNKYQTIVVSDIHCSMTAVEKIVSAGWFDRTFKALEEKGLVKKEAMAVEISGGYRKGEVYDSYGYNLTDLGLKYLGIDVKKDEKEQKVLSEESIQTQILKVVNLATEVFVGLKIDDNNQFHLWDYDKQQIVDDYNLPILYMTSREFDKQQEDKLRELKKRIQHLNTLLYNKVVQ